MTTAALTFGWLLVAHLVADFLLQTDTMAAAKVGPRPRALRSVVAHGTVVAVTLLPFAAAFGWPGLWALLIVAVLHGLLDLAKASLTRRAERRAFRIAPAIHEPAAQPATLGTAWTPVPAALFLLDQLAHVLVLAGTWWLLLRDAPVTAQFADLVRTASAGVSEADLGRLAGWTVVAATLVIVNVPAGSIFVGLLLRPDRVLGAEPAATAAPAPPSPPAYRVRLGPLEGRVAPEPVAAAATLATPARVGSAVGILERLLIVAFVLARADTAIGLVIAAKTIARFKQLDDREFAEYYLLGTLASVAVAVLSAIAARSVLAAF